MAKRSKGQSTTEKRSRGNYVLFLVEGKSEREALEQRIASLIDRVDEYAEVRFLRIARPDEKDPTKTKLGGDVTTLFDVYSKNYGEKVYDYFIKDYSQQKEYFYPKDIRKIYQIVDLDGAFIPDENIVKGSPPEGHNAHYGTSQITVQDPQHILKPHQRKADMLNYLKTQTEIKIGTKTIPFEIYFFSCNLDHFLHHNANLDFYDKVGLAEGFASGFAGDDDGFAKFFTDDKDAAQGQTYEESWEKATEEGSLFSLERHTNINLLLEQLLS